MSTKYLFSALKAKVGNPYQKLLLVALADIADEKGQCWPSHAYLAGVAECSRSTVIRHLGELESRGFVVVNRRTAEGIKTSNVYQLPDVSERHNDVSERHNDVSERHRGSVRVTHNTTNDTPSCINAVAWAEWEQYRKERGKKITPSTAKKQFKFLSDYDFETQQQIIDASIGNGWAGLFAPKEHSDGRGKSDSRTQDARRLTPGERTQLARERAYERERLEREPG